MNTNRCRFYNSKIRYILLLLGVILASISILKGIANGLLGQPIDFMHQQFRDICYNRDASGIPQFPSTMLLIFLLGLFSYRTAQVIWLILQFFFTGALIFFFRGTFFKKWNRVDYLIMILLMISGAPWRTNLSNLQYTLCSFTFYMCGIWLLENGGGGMKGDIAAGIAFSFSFFKIQLIVPLMAVLLYKRKWIPFAVMVTSQIIALIAACLWFGDFWMLTFAKISDILSLNSGASGYIDFGVIFRSAYLKYAATLLCIVLIIVISWKLKKTQCINEELKYHMYFSWLLLCSLVIFYHRSYDYFMCIIPLAFMIEAWCTCKNQLNFTLLLLCLVSVIFMNIGVTLNEFTSVIVIRWSYYAMLIGLTTKVIMILMKEETSSVE